MYESSELLFRQFPWVTELSLLRVSLSISNVFNIFFVIKSFYGSIVPSVLRDLVGWFVRTGLFYNVFFLNTQPICWQIMKAIKITTITTFRSIQPLNYKRVYPTNSSSCNTIDISVINNQFNIKKMLSRCLFFNQPDKKHSNTKN